MKRTLIITLVVAAIVTVLVLLGITDSNQATIPSKSATTEKTDTAQSSPGKQFKETIPEPPAKTTENPQKCISKTALADSKALSVAKQYLFKLAGFGRIDNENYLNEPQLLAQAEAGNTYAMLILGKNYLWHSAMESFQAMSTRPPELPERENIPRPFDQQTMEKARYWLNKAALNGEFGALDSLAYSYSDEWHHLRAQNPVDKQQVQTMLLTSKAYKSMQIWLLPEVFGREYDLTPGGLKPQHRSEFDYILRQLQTQWTQDRRDLGYDSELRLDIPPEVRMYSEMASQVCGSK